MNLLSGVLESTFDNKIPNRASRAQLCCSQEYKLYLWQDPQIKNPKYNPWSPVPTFNELFFLAESPSSHQVSDGIHPAEEVKI